MLRKTILVIILLGMVFSLVGCQTVRGTVQGIGRDMTWVGQQLSGDSTYTAE